MDSIGRLKPKPPPNRTWSPALDQMRRDAGTVSDVVSLRLNHVVTPRLREPTALRELTTRTAGQVARSLLPPWVELPEGEERAEFTELVGRTQSLEEATRLWSELESHPPEKREKVKQVLQGVEDGATATTKRRTDV